MIRSKQRILLAKTEAAYGVEEVLAPATDAVLAYDLEIEPMKGPTEELDPDRGYMGHGDMAHTSPHQGFKFGVDVASSGAAGTAPAWGKLLTACGNTEAITVGQDVKYTPTAFTANFGALTTALRKGRNLHKTLGCRGSYTAAFKLGGNPRFSFSFDGLREAPTAAAYPAGIALAAWKDPQPCNFDNTSLSLFGFDVTAHDLSFDAGNEVSVRVVTAEESVIIVNRKPTFTVMIEETDVDVKDWEALIAAGTLGAFALEHGVGAGNIVLLDAPAIQLTGITPGKTDGVNTLQLQGRFRPVAGNDEYVWTAK